jgi:hypothetical protein
MTIRKWQPNATFSDGLTMKSYGLMERRRAQRYQLELPILVGAGGRNSYPVKNSILRNISSTGAFFIDDIGHWPGEWVTIWIKFPYRKNNWLVYSGRVTRVKRVGFKDEVGVKFCSLRPLFCEVGVMEPN